MLLNNSDQPTSPRVYDSPYINMGSQGNALSYLVSDTQQQSQQPSSSIQSDDDDDRCSAITFSPQQSWTPSDQNNFGSCSGTKAPPNFTLQTKRRHG